MRKWRQIWPKQTRLKSAIKAPYSIYSDCIHRFYFTEKVLAMSVSYECENDTPQLVELNVEYAYYGTTRRTPVYIEKNQLNSMTYDELTSFIVSEIPYIGRIFVPLRYCISDGTNNEVDLSPKYCSHQISRLLRSSLQTFRVKVIESESPLSSSTCKGKAVTVNVRRDKSTKIGASFSSKQTKSDPVDAKSSKHVPLPLERYSQKQDAELKRLNDAIEEKRTELTIFDEKLNQASRENGGALAACGKCHLKVGHTRRNCAFSPCKSAFSCGILAKHSEQKSERSVIEKIIKNLTSKSSKVQSDTTHAKMVIQKVSNSNSKRIEDIVMKELPHRYTVRGFRNWALLNVDVVRLAERLKGTLPTRENVLPLLSDILPGQDSDDDDDDILRPRVGCGSRVLPQKRLLEDEYAIQFPTTKKSRSRELFPPELSSTFASDQEANDFKMAVELQHAENLSCRESADIEISDSDHDSDDTTCAAASVLLSLNKFSG